MATFTKQNELPNKFSKVVGCAVTCKSTMGLWGALVHVLTSRDSEVGVMLE